MTTETETVGTSRRVRRHRWHTRLHEVLCDGLSILPARLPFLPAFSRRKGRRDLAPGATTHRFERTPTTTVVLTIAIAQPLASRRAQAACATRSDCSCRALPPVVRPTRLGSRK